MSSTMGLLPGFHFLPMSLIHLSILSISSLSSKLIKLTLNFYYLDHLNGKNETEDRDIGRKYGLS